MTCFHPRRLFYADPEVLPGQLVTADPAKALAPENPFFVPCGKCVGCLKSRSLSWSSRLWAESLFHAKNCFLTLTYDDEHVPLELEYRHVQLFLKRLRKRFGPFRFFCAGEYGSQTLRPHWHLLIFGLDFDDVVPVPGGRGFVSVALTSLWTFGHHLVGTLTPASIRYTSKYMLKGSDVPFLPDGSRARKAFCVMSRNPGIGHLFVDKYATDLRRDHAMRFDGRPVPIPRYFSDKLGLDYQLSSSARLDDLSAGPHFLREHTPERLKVRESVSAHSSTFFSKDKL